MFFSQFISEILYAIASVIDFDLIKIRKFGFLPNDMKMHYAYAYSRLELAERNDFKFTLMRKKLTRTKLNLFHNNETYLRIRNGHDDQFFFFLILISLLHIIVFA